MNKQRDIRIDCAKGLAILLMIIGHAHIPDLLFKIIYSFHMPLFVLLSGYFFKPKTVMESFSNDGNRLLLPYVVVCVIYLGSVWIHCLFDGNYQWLKETTWAAIYANIGPTEHAPGIGSVWFLPALFWCKVVYNVLALVLSSLQHIKILPLVSCILAIAAVYGVNNGIILPFNLMTGISLILFYQLGVSFKEAENKGVFAHLSSSQKWIGIFFLFCFWIGGMLAEKPLVVGGCEYSNLVAQVLGSVGATLIVIMVLGFVKQYLSPLSVFFAWCGRNSMEILCINFLLSACGIVWLLPIPVTGTVAFIFSFIVTLLLSFCWSRIRQIIASA